jgi:uncharacterized protein (DUF2267 family)
MRREELLNRIRELGDVSSLERADRVLKAVIDAMSSDMTDEQRQSVAGYLPDEFRADWMPDWGHPQDILEKEEMMFDPAIKR